MNDHDPIPGEELLPSQADIDFMAAIATQQSASGPKSNDEPESSPDGDVDGDGPDVEPAEGNDDDIELIDGFDLTHALLLNVLEDDVDEQLVGPGPVREGQLDRIGRPVAPHLGHSLDGQYVKHTLSDGSVVRFDKVTTSKSERAVAIARLEAEIASR